MSKPMSRARSAAARCQRRTSRKSCLVIARACVGSYPLPPSTDIDRGASDAARE